MLEERARRLWLEIVAIQARSKGNERKTKTVAAITAALRSAVDLGYEAGHEDGSAEGYHRGARG